MSLIDKKGGCMRTWIVGLVILVSNSVLAHCEIPCGIHDDQLRFQMIEESIQTIDLSSKVIRKLSQNKKLNLSQIIRWTLTKEEQAGKIRSIMTDYFLVQRMKVIPEFSTAAYLPRPAEKKKKHMRYMNYLKELKLVHRIVIQTMRVKQSHSKSRVVSLRQTVDDFHKLYKEKFRKHPH